MAKQRKLKPVRNPMARSLHDGSLKPRVIPQAKHKGAKAKGKLKRELQRA